MRADWESRHARDSSDWMMQRDIFLQLRAWAINNQPVCISNKCTTSNVLQLETQSTCIGCGCSVHLVPALHVPFICVDKLVPGG